MASSSGGKCCKCGKILKNGLKYISNGKHYCYDCYQLLAVKIEQEQEKKTKVYNYIKELYKIQSLPEFVLEGINRLLKEGYKEDDILYTIYYIYKIKAIDLDLEFLIFNIKKYTKEADEYHCLQLKIAAANEKAVIETAPVVVKIKKSDLEQQSKPKFKYNIEDL